jgi:hypothetical protein
LNLWLISTTIVTEVPQQNHPEKKDQKNFNFQRTDPRRKGSSTTNHNHISQNFLSKFESADSKIKFKYNEPYTTLRIPPKSTAAKLTAVY